MNELKSESFEISELKKGLSGNEYDLSEKGLSKLSVVDLQDLLKNDYYVFDSDELNIINSDIISKDELLVILNKQLLDFHTPKNFNSFGITIPELTNVQKRFYTEDNFSKSVITSLTHGTYNIPSDIRKSIKDEIHHSLLNENKSNNSLYEIKSDEILLEVDKRYSQFLRILKNYSDFGTRHLVKHSFIPKGTVVRATKSRGITDPARAAGEALKTDDFCNNVLPTSLFDGVEEGTESYKLFHKLLQELIDATIITQGGVTLIDDHDTGATCTGKNVNEDTYKTGGFPLVNLGVKDGTSCNKEIVTYYAERIEYHLGIKPTIDEPYKGGYVTTHYGKEGREKLIEQGENPEILNVIQQEVGKYLYLDGRTQELDFEKVKIIGEGLARAKADLGRKFGKEYFAAIKQGVDTKEEYLKNYQELS